MISGDGCTRVVHQCTGVLSRMRQPHRLCACRNMMKIDWDDVRYFLAVARHGSVRAAADNLEVNHTTVLRRIAQLEARLGTQMFEKLPAGYRLTDAGEQVQEFAEQMESSSHQLESRI